MHWSRPFGAALIAVQNDSNVLKKIEKFWAPYFLEIPDTPREYR